MSLDYAQLVLAGILPDNKENLLYAIQHLEAQHFRVPRQKTVFDALGRYYDRTGGIVEPRTFIDLLQNNGVESARILMFEELMEELVAEEVSDHEFKYAVGALKDLRADMLTGEHITTGFEILNSGAEIDGEMEQGHRAARRFLYEKFGEVDSLDNMEAAPEGDMRHESDEILQEYLDRKNGVVGRGVLTGIEAIDNVTDGAHAGEVWIVAAYTSQGKTQFASQTAWHAAVKQGKNIFLATTETSRATVRRRIIARHSREPQFGLPDGLNSKSIRNGALTDEEELIFQDVVHDLKTNPDYGKMHIAQVPRGATLSYLASRMARSQQQWNLDLCVIDYLALLRSERARNSEREEFNEILRATKVLATSFNEGNGIPIISPWQIKRADYEEAVKTGAYGLACLSDTSEAEKTADLIVSMLRLPETPSEATLQILKNRDGEIPEPMTVSVDYRSTFLGSTVETTLGSDFDLGSFLD